MIASTQITNTDIFAFIAVLVFKLLLRSIVLFISMMVHYFNGMVDRALSPAGTIVSDSHHRESPTRRVQGFNPHRIRV